MRRTLASTFRLALGFPSLPAVAAIAAVAPMALAACVTQTVDDTYEAFDLAASDRAAPDDGGGVDGASASPDLAGSPCTGAETFQQARTAMLSTCGGFPMCHLRAPFAGNLDLTDANAYASLVNVPASIAPNKLRVKPGDSAHSFLVQKLTNTQGPNEGSPMPRGEAIMWQPPDPQHLQTLECWIQNGAKNN